MEYLLFLNVLMLTRLAYLFVGENNTSRVALWVSAAQIASLFIFSWDVRLLGLCLLLMLANGSGWWLEKRGHRADEVRCLLFLCVILTSSFLLNQETRLASWFIAGTNAVVNNSWLTNGIETDAWLPRFNALLAGALFLTNEANLWIRTCFHRLNLEPKLNDEQTGANQQEYNAGRVIGILERNLMYVIIVLGNNFAAVGFILAAKGFARFKQLDERQFAEYVLIGTLASTFITLLLAVLVRAYIG